MAERVYILDDDPGSADRLARTLTGAGFQARTIPSPEALDQAVRASAPGWLLLDIGVPGADRIGLIRDLSARGDWPVIAMCPVPDLPLAARSLHAGARDVLVKPFSPAELLAVVRAAELRD